MHTTPLVAAEIVRGTASSLPRVRGTVERQSDTHTYTIRYAGERITVNTSGTQLAVGEEVVLTKRGAALFIERSGATVETGRTPSDAFDLRGDSVGGGALAGIFQLHNRMSDGIAVPVTAESLEVLETELRRILSQSGHDLEATQLVGRIEHDLKEILARPEDRSAGAQLVEDARALHRYLQEHLPAREGTTLIAPGAGEDEDVLFFFRDSQQAISFLANRGIDPQEAARLVEKTSPESQIILRVAPAGPEGSRIVLLTAAELAGELRFMLAAECSSPLLRLTDPSLLREVLQENTRLDMQLLREIDAYLMEVTGSGAEPPEAAHDASKFSQWLRIVLGAGISPHALPKGNPFDDAALVGIVAQQVFGQDPAGAGIRVPIEELAAFDNLVLQAGRANALALVLTKLGLTFEHDLLMEGDSSGANMSFKELLLRSLSSVPQSPGPPPLTANPAPGAITAAQPSPPLVGIIANLAAAIEQCAKAFSALSSDIAPRVREEIAAGLATARGAADIGLLKMQLPHENLVGEAITGRQLPDKPDQPGTGSGSQGLLRLTVAQLAGRVEQTVTGLLSLIDEESPESCRDLRQSLTRILLRAEEAARIHGDGRASPGAPAEKEGASPSSTDLLRSMAQRILNRLESLQILARPAAAPGGGEQHVWAVPLRIAGEWTEVKFRFDKKPISRRSAKSGRGFTAVVSAAPSSLGEVEARLDYRPKKEFRLAMRFARQSVRAWFEAQRTSFADAFGALGLPAAGIEFGMIRNTRQESNETVAAKTIDGKVDIRI